MSTGDLDAKLALLRRALGFLRYPGIFDECNARKGSPNSFLPILTFLLHRYSRYVAALAAAHDAIGRRGRRYVDAVLRLAREALGLRVGMTTAQFLAEVSQKYPETRRWLSAINGDITAVDGVTLQSPQGYAVRKLELVHSICVACQEYHRSAARQERLLSVRSKRAQRCAAKQDLEPGPRHPPNPKNIEAKSQSEDLSRHYVQHNIHAPAMRSKGCWTGAIGSPPELPRKVPAALQGARVIPPGGDPKSPTAIPGAEPNSVADTKTQDLNEDTLPSAPMMRSDTADCGDHSCAGDPEVGRHWDSFEAPTCTTIALPSSWIATLDGRLAWLEARMQKAEECIDDAIRCTGVAETSMQAHLRVLEARVLSMERVSWERAATFHPPTGNSHKNSTCDGHEHAGQADGRAGDGHCGAQARCDAPVGAWQHASDAAVQSAAPPREPNPLPQQWTRWDSPTACFNPLFVQPQGQVQQHPPPEQHAGATPLQPWQMGVVDEAGGEEHTPSTGAASCTHAADVFHVLRSSAASTLCGEDTQYDEGNTSQHASLLNALHARLSQAEALFAHVRTVI